MAKNRRQKSPPFVMLPHWVLRSPAWRSLSPNARAIYLELKARFNGANNGMIGLGCREAAEATNMHKNSANRAIQELEDTGFIQAAVKGAFRQNGRKATDWLLTELQDDRTGHAPLKSFMSTAFRKNPSPSTGTVSPSTGTQTDKTGQRTVLRPSTGTETRKRADLASLQRDTSRSTIPLPAERAQDATKEAPPQQGARPPEERTSGGPIPISSSLLSTKAMRGVGQRRPPQDFTASGELVALLGRVGDR